MGSRTYNLYSQVSPLVTHRIHLGCSPLHFTFRLRHGSQENALFFGPRSRLAGGVFGIISSLVDVLLDRDVFKQ
jgi:hypothetical protein